MLLTSSDMPRLLSHPADLDNASALLGHPLVHDQERRAGPSSRGGSHQWRPVPVRSNRRPERVATRRKQGEND